jgi:predicted GIY-YIG superfamily endonuclease
VAPAELKGNDGPNHMNEFVYVYILESLAPTGGFYVGLTDNLSARLAKHNAGEVSHTAKLRPWQIKTAIAFRSRDKAAEFERYLKSPSGRAFSKKRL